MNYCLTAINKTKQAVFRYELAQIHSLYTSSSQLNFMTSCRLQPTDQPIPVSTELKKTSSPLINMVQMTFDGKGIQTGEAVQILLKRVTEDVTFKNCEHFLIDPEQYSPNTKIIYISFNSDCDSLQKRYYSLIEVDRRSFCKKTIYQRVNMKIFNEYMNKGIRTKVNKVYLVRVEKN